MLVLISVEVVVPDFCCSKLQLSAFTCQPLQFRSSSLLCNITSPMGLKSGRFFSVFRVLFVVRKEWWFP